MYTSKSLISANSHIDVGKSPNYASERYTIPTFGACSDPQSLNHDIYGRYAAPETLSINTQGGSCNFSSPVVNLQNYMIREMNIDRPYIYTDITGSFGGYDALGVGRNMQKTYTGGLGNNVGGFERLNMDRNNKSNIEFCRPPVFRTTDPSAHKSMGSMNVSVYNA